MAIDKTIQSHQALVAIKQIDLKNLDMDKKPQIKELLQKEIDILQKARHKHLISLLDMK